MILSKLSKIPMFESMRTKKKRTCKVLGSMRQVGGIVVEALSHSRCPFSFFCAWCAWFGALLGSPRPLVCTRDVCMANHNMGTYQGETYRMTVHCCTYAPVHEERMRFGILSIQKK